MIDPLINGNYYIIIIFNQNIAGYFVHFDKIDLRVSEQLIVLKFLNESEF